MSAPPTDPVGEDKAKKQEDFAREVERRLKKMMKRVSAMSVSDVQALRSKKDGERVEYTNKLRNELKTRTGLQNLLDSQTPLEQPAPGSAAYEVSLKLDESKRRVKEYRMVVKLRDEEVKKLDDALSTMSDGVAAENETSNIVEQELPKNTEKPATSSFVGMSANGESVASLECRSDGPDSVNNNQMAHVKYSFQSRGGSELSLNKGDVCVVLKAAETGWWLVQKGNDMGHFPSNYLRVMEDEEISESQSVSADQPAPEKAGEPMIAEWQPAWHVAVAECAFEGLGLHDLSFAQGSRILVRRRHIPSGWWEGECGGRKGLFPSTYVRLLQPEETVSRARAARVEEESSPTAIVGIALMASPEAVNAEFDLVFDQGDIICVLSQDSSGWWYGRIDDRYGLFPRTLIRVIPPGESVAEARQHVLQPVVEPPSSVNSNVNGVDNLVSSLRGRSDSIDRALKLLRDAAVDNQRLTEALAHAKKEQQAAPD